MKIRRFPEEKDRVETGPIQFANDWPGCFIRGDNASYYICVLKRLIEDPESLKHPMTQIQLKDLIRTLSSCIL